VSKASEDFPLHSACDNSAFQAEDRDRSFKVILAAPRFQPPCQSAPDAVLFPLSSNQPEQSFTDAICKFSGKIRAITRCQVGMPLLHARQELNRREVLALLLQFVWHDALILEEFSVIGNLFLPFLRLTFRSLAHLIGLTPRVPRIQILHPGM